MKAKEYKVDENGVPYFTYSNNEQPMQNIVITPMPDPNDETGVIVGDNSSPVTSSGFTVMMESLAKAANKKVKQRQAAKKQ